MTNPELLPRLSQWTAPALLAAGLTVSAGVAWYSATRTGAEAFFWVFTLLAAVTVAVSASLGWLLRSLIRQTQRAEDALIGAREGEARFRDLADLSSDWYWEQDAQFRYTQASGGVHEKGRFNFSDAIGRTRWELPSVGVSEAEWAEHRALLERHESFQDFTYRIRAADDKVRWFSISGRPVFAPDGSFAGYRGTGRDISERKRQEAEILAARNQLAGTLDAIPDLLFELGLDGYYHDYHSPRTELLAAPPENLLGRKVADVLPPDAASVVLAALQEANEQGRSHGKQFELPLPQGKMWFELSVSRKRGEPGQAPRFIVLSRDITERRAMESALRSSAERLSEAQRIAQIGSWELDLANNALSWSDEIFRLFEIDKSRFGASYEAFLDAIHPDDRDRVNEAYTRSLEARTPYEITHRLRMSDGRIKWVQERCTSDFDAEGKPIRSLGTVQDVTERRQMEEELHGLNRDFIHFLENATDFIYFKDENSRFRFCSQTLANITGHASWRDMIGKHDLEVFPEDTAKIYHEEELPVFRDGIPLLNKTDPYYDAAGRPGWVNTNKWPVFDDAGKVVGIFGISRDVTELRRTELELRLAATVFENSREGVTITDADRNIISVNRAFTDITGYEAHEVIGKNPRILQSGRIDAAFYKAMWSSIRGKGYWTGEIENRRKSGEVYTEILSITEVRDAQGRPLHYIGVFTDITELKRAEREIRLLNDTLEQRVRERTAALEASNRELEAFSYSVSHDLRAPLRGIDGFAHVLAEDYGDRLDEAGRAHLQRIRQASQRLSQTIDDMIELAQITRAPIHRREADLSALARAVLLELGEGSGRQLDVVVGEHISAQADPALLRVLLENLLNNAWKFTGRTGNARIEFGEKQIDGERTFFVRDNGAGFDSAYAGKLFKMFQRLHRPDEFAGTGIGLATVQRIVQRHGGRIWAESTPNMGATFYFTLG